MNKIIIAIVIGLFFTGGVYVYTQKESGVQDTPLEIVGEISGFRGLIPAADFAEKIESEEYIILDVRTPEEYATQRIGGDALLVNFYDVDFKQQLDALDKSKKYLLHCRSGGRSSQATKMMKELGFEEFYELQGGINSWNQSSFSTYSGQIEKKEVGNTD